MLPFEDTNRDDWESCISREQTNMDIRINISDTRVYVVENKIKSTPTEEQLEGYVEDLGTSFMGGILTGIIEPTFPLNASCWRFLSYKNIAEKIAELFTEDPIIESYVKDLRAIDGLLSTIIKKTESSFLCTGI